MPQTSIETIAAKQEPRFTVGTLVNDDSQYAQMIASLEQGGFAQPDTEFIAARQATSAFAALNAILERAKGEYVILCHQDIRLLEDGRASLDTLIEDLSQAAPDWALAGNAGGEAPGRLALRISDPHGSDRQVGTLPARVMSLDENFIVMRRSAGVRFSRDLDGFHLYGADICLHADILGWSSWVINFHIQHLSAGRKDQSFRMAEQRFRQKWSKALRPRWMQTPCTLLRLSGRATPGLPAVILERIASRIARRLPRAQGWTPAFKSQSR